MILPYRGNVKTPTLFKSSRREIQELIANLVWARGGDPAMQQLWSCFPDPFCSCNLPFKCQALQVQQLPLGCSAGPGSALALAPATPPCLEPKLELNREKTPLPLTADHRDDLGSCTKAGRRYLVRNLFNLPDDSLPLPLHHFYGSPGGRCRTQPALPSKRLIHLH